MSLTLIKQAQAKPCLRDEKLTRIVKDIINNVRARGETALLEYAEQFDKTRMETVHVARETVLAAYNNTPPQTIAALRFAHSRIKNFAEQQLACTHEIKTETKGVKLECRLLPVESCGCYVPAGRHPLPSSALMSITTAKAAGVRRIAACSPPSNNTGVHPAVLVAMDIAGADEIYCMGGAGAIAAFAYGAANSKSEYLIQKVDMIAGPGNRFVTEAKRQVLGDVGIDGFAGPSEVLIIADKTANPGYIAADLLAQAEHDTDAKSEFVCTDKKTIEKTLAELEKQLDKLASKKTAGRSWADNGEIYLADTIDDAIELANNRAPEHIELQTAPEAEQYACKKLNAYGSLFVGHYAPAAFGDYVSGANHILPTMGSARFSGGLWTGSFLRAAFCQSISEEGCAELAGSCMTLAETEGLPAHRGAVDIRLKRSADEQH
ncbi:MAG: histidinol dehydrogenase [Spirochaetaceae bacterium]|jgi:histidinol dehydrogenase/sulfopropanediol 3-dehydrogenase|nr:histidinol dehydrogenase [Spirochaetaceae bacterium]